MGRVHGLCSRVALVPDFDQVGVEGRERGKERGREGMREGGRDILASGSTYPTRARLPRHGHQVLILLPFLSPLPLLLSSTPRFCSNFQAYHLYGFWTYEGCKHFLETDTSHAGGANRQLLFLVAGNKYPETEKAFCRDTRVALLGQFAQFVMMHLAIGACLLVVLANWRIEKPSMQLHLFGSKASSFLFPDAPPGQENGEGGREGGSSQHRGEGGGGRRRVSSAASNSCSVLQEPLLSPSGAGGAGGGGGTGLRPPLHHRRQSSGSVASHRGGGHGRGRSSVNDHLLGPVLD